MGLRLPSSLVRMSVTPASSRMARGTAPAITPVPGAAGQLTSLTYAPDGFSTILEAPNSTSISWGMVPFWRGTSTMLRRA